MRAFDRHWLMDGVARQMRRVALTGYYNGVITTMDHAYFERCKALHVSTGSILIFTRDIGMHQSGWWKNPDYERCWHLSLSFRDDLTMEPAPQNHRIAGQWIEAFYGDNKRYVWAEPPYSERGKTNEVWHYRVFCDPAWHPIIPRGEVYTREFTERGWKSFSDLQDYNARELAKLEALPGEQ